MIIQVGFFEGRKLCCDGTGMLIFNLSPLGTTTEIGEKNKDWLNFSFYLFYHWCNERIRGNPCQQHMADRVECRMDVLRLGGVAQVGNLQGDDEVTPGVKCVGVSLSGSWKSRGWMSGPAKSEKTSPHARGWRGKSNFVSLRGFIWMFPVYLEFPVGITEVTHGILIVYSNYCCWEWEYYRHNKHNTPTPW